VLVGDRAFAAVSRADKIMADLPDKLVLFYAQQCFGMVIGIDDRVGLRFDDQNAGLNPVKDHFEDILTCSILCRTGTFFAVFAMSVSLGIHLDVPGYIRLIHISL
jgi:hypothetical protein